MKVFDLQCRHQHVFEGWFGSEDDFVSQQGRGLIECPVCGDSAVSKMLSAPRLNLGTVRGGLAAKPEDASVANVPAAIQAAWMEVSRRIMANTDDVGDRFAEEARKIHYGEVEERGIRGRASRAETEALVEEGIAVMPLLPSEEIKGPLH